MSGYEVRDRRLARAAGVCSLLSWSLTLACTGSVASSEQSVAPPAGGAAVATGGTGASMGGSPGAAGSVPAAPAIAPGPSTLPHLTVQQYRNAVTRVFGGDVTIPELLADDRPDFYAVIGAARQPLTDTAVSLFWEASKSIAEQVTKDPAHRERLVSCPSAPAVDEACIAAFLSQTGARLLRRPLTSEEVARYSGLITTTARGNLWRGLRFGLTALLSSPAFLYRHERLLDTDELPGTGKYDDLALASRLSFLLTNDGPDDELLAKATAGELSAPAQLTAQLERLYPVAMASGLREFFHEYLELDAAGRLDFEGDQDAALGDAMREEVLLLARDAVAPGADFRRLFRTRDTYLNGPLATHYGVTGPRGAAMVPFTLPESSKRGGLLTTGALLTAEGAEDRTKPTNRGLYVQFRLMCTHIPDPPDDIPKLEDTGKDPVATSVREVLELHQKDPTCAACHSHVDPIGIGMEDFDQFGRYRETYSDGSAVDARSSWNGMPFTGAAALGALLADDPRVAECMTKQLFRYATARLETGNGELALVETLRKRFADSSFSFKELVTGLVTSESFRYAKKQEP